MTVVPVQPAGGRDVARWDEEQIDLLKRDLGIRSDAHLAYFAEVCGHKHLDPFLDEIVPIYYGDDMVIQETVEGLRTIAERSGLYGGYRGPWYCGPEGNWHEGIWLGKGNPAGAKYLVLRKDWTDPAPGYARWASCVQLDRNGNPRGLWKTRPDEMLAKTAEARALKRAFAKEFARAGVNVRTLTDAQVVAAEGRRIGLSDEDRHALIAEITDGRTESSTELTDDERLAARAEIARRQPIKKTAAGPGGTETYWCDPDTGELVAPPSEPGDGGEVSSSAAADEPAPGPDNPPATQKEGPAPGGHPVPRPKPGERQDVADVKYRIWALLPEDQKPGFAQWLKACGIPDSIDVSRAKVAAINAELDRRGVPPVRDEKGRTNQ